MARLPLLLLLSLVAMLAACSQHVPPASQLGVVDVYPAAGATGVPVDTAVWVTFDSELDAGAVAEALLLNAGDLAVTGTLSVDTATNSLVFVPSSTLLNGTTYVAALAESLTGLGGASLKDAVTWSFETQAAEPGEGDPGEPGDSDGDGIPDDVDSDPFDPDADGDGIPDGEFLDNLDGVLDIDPKPGTVTSNRASISIVLDRAIDPATLDADTISVYTLPAGNPLKQGRAPKGAPLAGALTYDAATQTLTFTFENLLPTAPPWYWVVLDLDVLDADGDEFTVGAYWRYKVK